MTLDWTPQYTHVLQTMKHKLSRIRSARVSAESAVYLIGACVRPAATYCFSVAPFTDTQLHALDSLLTAAYKHAYGLPTQASTAQAHAALTSFGLGCPSLHVDYHHTCCEQFTRAQ